MTTVRERLMTQADTDAERALLAIWLDEDAEGVCARQRAWQRIEVRSSRAGLRFSW